MESNGRVDPGGVGQKKIGFMRKLISGLILLFVTAGALFGYWKYSRYRDLRETLIWMDQTYNPHEGGDNLGRGHGWQTHYLVKDQTEQVTEEFHTTFTFGTDCNITIRGETSAIGVFRDAPSTYTYAFRLCDMDPSSIKIKTYDLHRDVFDCADQEAVKAYNLNCDAAEIEFLTRDGVTAVHEQGSRTYFKLTGKDRELKHDTRSNKAWLIVDDVQYAHRLATALEHAIELCGGRPSKF